MGSGCWWLVLLSGTVPGLPACAGRELLPHLSDAEQEAGHGGDGVVQVLLHGVFTEHVVKRLAQLNELLLVHLGKILNRFLLSLFLLGPHSKVVPIVRRAGPLLLSSLFLDILTATSFLLFLW